MKTKRKRCGCCEGCRAIECGKCRYCLDMKKRGGSGTLRRPCEKRGCIATSSGEGRGDSGRIKKAQKTTSIKTIEERRTICIDGFHFDSLELCTLCQAVAEEHSDRDQNIDWSAISTKLQNQENSFDALLTLRRAATRLEDEARAIETAKEKQEATSKNSLEKKARRNNFSIPKSKKGRTQDDIKIYEYPHPNLRDILPTAKDTQSFSRSKLEQQIQNRIKATSKKERWSPARCRALWRWLAYAQDPPSSTSDDTSSSEEEIVSSFHPDDDRAILDPWEQAYRAQSSTNVQKDDKVVPEKNKNESTLVQMSSRPRGDSSDSSSSRLGDLTAAALFCEKQQNRLPPTITTSTQQKGVSPMMPAQFIDSTPSFTMPPPPNTWFPPPMNQNLFALGLPPPCFPAPFMPPPPSYPARPFNQHFGPQ
mmetsp:Transcript_1418/g.1869  ORF Transcript_1418/g.1869 Transcript_1418/m.1869 type:complete len:422 (+) Transcript_1418:212-1477(+)